MQKSINGKIGPMMATCDTIGIDKFQTWRILHHGFYGRKLAIYLMDIDQQIFVNHHSSTKLPILTKGWSEASEVADPKRLGIRLVLERDSLFHVSGLDGGFQDEIYQVYTIYLYVWINHLPKYGDFETILSFVLDFNIDIQIDWQGRLRAYGDENHWVGFDSIKMGVSTVYGLMLHFGRPKVPYTTYWCSIIAQLDSNEEQGGIIDCTKKFFDRIRVVFKY